MFNDVEGLTVCQDAKRVTAEAPDWILDSDDFSQNTRICSLLVFFYRLLIDRVRLGGGSKRAICITPHRRVNFQVCCPSFSEAPLGSIPVDLRSLV
jgi:hypothetical protein